MSSTAQDALPSNPPPGPPPPGPPPPGPPPPGPPPTGPPPSQAPNGFQGPGSSSNLYLVAFLATLLLLLLVSCCIVLRSYIIRRQNQRRLEEARALGLYPAPRTSGSKKKRLVTKPKLISTWLAAGGEKWNQMMPLSAQHVYVKRKIRETPKNKPSETSTTQPDLDSTAADSGPPTTRSPISSNYNHGLIRMTNNFLTRIRRSSLHDARGTQLPRDNAGATKRTASGLASNYRIRVEMLQLSVLISMPSANKSKRKNHILEKTDPDRDEDDGDLELPNMVFGVTRINYRQPTSTLGPTHLPHTKINDAPI